MKQHTLRLVLFLKAGKSARVRDVFAFDPQDEKSNRLYKQAIADMARNLGPGEDILVLNGKTIRGILSAYPGYASLLAK